MRTEEEDDARSGARRGDDTGARVRARRAHSPTTTLPLPLRDVVRRPCTLGGHLRAQVASCCDTFGKVGLSSVSLDFYLLKMLFVCLFVCTLSCPKWERTSLIWGIRVALPHKENQLQQSRYPAIIKYRPNDRQIIGFNAQPSQPRRAYQGEINHQVHAGSFRVSIIHRTLTGTTRIFNVRTCSFSCACVYMHTGVGHNRQRVSTTFLTRKNSQFCLVLLTQTGFEPRVFRS